MSADEQSADEQWAQLVDQLRAAPAPLPLRWTLAIIGLWVLALMPWALLALLAWAWFQR